MRGRTIVIAAAACAAALVTGTARAHHAFSAEFDANKPVVLRGTVTKTEWINPHSWIHVAVKGSDGKTESWAIEGGTPNTLMRRGISRDTVSPLKELVIEKDVRNEPTGVFIEYGMQPTAELIWFKEATRFSRADRVRGLSLAAQAYHAFGTTGIFEGHGVANEVIRAYKDAYRNGNLTMRAGLVFSPNWKAAGNAPLDAFMEAWAGWLGEPAFGDDWLKVTGLYVNIGGGEGENVRASAAPYTGWAGFNYDTALPRARVKDVLIQCARNDIRAILNSNSPGLIDLLDEVDREVPLKGRRWVLVHINIVSPRDIERIARMGLVLTSHTNSNVYKEGHSWQARLPPERRRDNSPLRDLMDAGLGSLPGGGAEIFCDRVRRIICDHKIDGAQWLEIARISHQLGLKSNCTMLYGHIETEEDRVDHLIKLRELQDETGGFQTFIPLAFHPANTPLEHIQTTTGFDDIKNIAVARLMLDNIPHIKAFWIATGVEVAQTSLWFGVDDLDGTVQEEKIYHMAGSSTPEGMTTTALTRLVRAAGREPLERDTFYNIVNIPEVSEPLPA